MNVDLDTVAINLIFAYFTYYLLGLQSHIRHLSGFRSLDPGS